MRPGHIINTNIEIPPITGNFVEDGHNLAKWIGEEGEACKQDGRAFRRLFQNDMANELRERGIRLELMAQRVRDMIGIAVNDRLKDSETSTGQMLAVALAGCLRPPMEKEKDD